MKQLILNLINKAGYDLQKVSKTQKERKIGSFFYAPIQNTATYSPWIADTEFRRVFKIIHPYSLVDIYRCYELWQLVEQAEKNDTKGDYLEVGAWQGGTSGIITSKLKSLRSDANLFIADTFEGVVKTGKKDNDYTGGEHSDTSETIVRSLLQEKLGIDKFTILKGVFPDQTVHLIPPESKFRFCHIDVDVYQGAKEITEWIWPRLITGGIIVFDDYGFVTTSGVTTYVEEIRHLPGCVIIYNLNGHAIIVKTQ